MAPHSSTLAWKLPWMEEPGRLQSMGSLGVGHLWATSLSCLGEGNGNPLQCSCLENPRDRGAWWAAVSGAHRVGHDWSDLAAAAVSTSKTRDWKRKGKFKLSGTPWGSQAGKSFKQLPIRRGRGCRDKGGAVENNTIALGPSPPQRIYTKSLNSSAKIKLPPKRRPREKVTVW